ncbi:MAG: type I 3-dehydroquinate dehydratase, partial [Sphaerochaetaceae bacterium]
MLCLTLTGSTLEENRALVARNRKWVALVELRLDYLLPDEQKIASSFPSTVDLPVILTMRRKIDGGQCDLPEKQRLQLLYEAAKGDFSYVDIEEDVRKSDLKFKDPFFEQKVDMENSLRKRGVKIIRSYHDYECVPADLFARIHKLASKGDIPKVAVTPQSMMDVITIFRVQQELSSQAEKIVIGMGPYGICTRILYKKCGSILSFCSDSQAAPGHLSAQSMSELYRSDKLDERTHIYGIIGNPVSHTASPQIH